MQLYNKLIILLTNGLCWFYCCGQLICLSFCFLKAKIHKGKYDINFGHILLVSILLHSWFLFLLEISIFIHYILIIVSPHSIPSRYSTHNKFHNYFSKYILSYIHLFATLFMYKAKLKNVSEIDHCISMEIKISHNSYRNPCIGRW